MGSFKKEARAWGREFSNQIFGRNGNSSRRNDSFRRESRRSIRSNQRSYNKAQNRAKRNGWI